MNFAKCAVTDLLVTVCIAESTLAGHLSHSAKHFLDSVHYERSFTVPSSFERLPHTHLGDFVTDNSQLKTLGIVASTSDPGAFFVTGTRGFNDPTDL